MTSLPIGGTASNESDLAKAFMESVPAVDMKDIIHIKEQAGDKVIRTAPSVMILSYARYCRYRAILKRIDGGNDQWTENLLVAALGGFSLPAKNTYVVFCRDTFDHDALAQNEVICDHLAPNLKGRPRKKKLLGKRSGSPSSDSNGSDGGKYYNTKVKKGELWTKEREFLEKLFQFMKNRKTPIKRVPSLGFKQINLYYFYKFAKKLGGYETITDKKLWKRIYDDLGGNPGSTSAATCTRRHYERLLLPFEQYMRNAEKNSHFVPQRGRPRVKKIYGEHRDKNKDGITQLCSQRNETPLAKTSRCEMAQNIPEHVVTATDNKKFANGPPRSTLETNVIPCEVQKENLVNGFYKNSEEYEKRWKHSWMVVTNEKQGSRAHLSRNVPTPSSHNTMFRENLDASFTTSGHASGSHATQKESKTNNPLLFSNLIHPESLPYSKNKTINYAPSSTSCSSPLSNNSHFNGLPVSQPRNTTTLCLPTGHRYIGHPYDKEDGRKNFSGIQQHGVKEVTDSKLLNIPNIISSSAFRKTLAPQSLSTSLAQESNDKCLVESRKALIRNGYHVDPGHHHPQSSLVGSREELNESSLRFSVIHYPVPEASAFENSVISQPIYERISPVSDPESLEETPQGHERIENTTTSWHSSLMSKYGRGSKENGISSTMANCLPEYNTGEGQRKTDTRGPSPVCGRIADPIPSRLPEAVAGTVRDLSFKLSKQTYLSNLGGIQYYSNPHLTPRTSNSTFTPARSFYAQLKRTRNDYRPLSPVIAPVSPVTPTSSPPLDQNYHNIYASPGDSTEDCEVLDLSLKKKSYSSNASQSYAQNIENFSHDVVQEECLDLSIKKEKQEPVDFTSNMKYKGHALQSSSVSHQAASSSSLTSMSRSSSPFFSSSSFYAKVSSNEINRHVVMNKYTGMENPTSFPCIPLLEQEHTKTLGQDTHNITFSSRNLLETSQTILSSTRTTTIKSTPQSHATASKLSPSHPLCNRSLESSFPKGARAGLMTHREILNCSNLRGDLLHSVPPHLCSMLLQDTEFKTDLIK
ncbi:uncharacterized protein LOC143255684 isoform X2 [Tachypleus tridentatus]